jgi:hypothetical protein
MQRGKKENFAALHCGARLPPRAKLLRPLINRAERWMSRSSLFVIEAKFFCVLRGENFRAYGLSVDRWNCIMNSK